MVLEQILISALTFVVGTTLGGAVATMKGIAPVRDKLGTLTTQVALVEKQVGEVLEWQDKWEDRLYDQATKKEGRE